MAQAKVFQPKSCLPTPQKSNDAQKGVAAFRGKIPLHGAVLTALRNLLDGCQSTFLSIKFKELEKRNQKEVEEGESRTSQIDSEKLKCAGMAATKTGSITPFHNLNSLLCETCTLTALDQIAVSIPCSSPSLRTVWEGLLLVCGRRWS